MGQFLTGERREWLNLMFMDKPVKGKYYIPIGVNELVVKSIKERETRNGKPMFVVQLYKPPQESRTRQNKMNFKPISCFHILGSGGKLSELWFRPFTTTLSRKQLESLRQKEKSKFKAVVKQKVKYIRNNEGELEYNMGGEAKWVDCEVVSVHSLDEAPEVDYFKLFEIEEK